MRLFLQDFLGWRQPLEIHPVPDAEFQRRLSEDFCAQNTAAIERTVSDYYDTARISIAFDPGAVRFAMSCAWSRTADRGSSFTFPNFEPGHQLETVVDRWLSFFDLFLQLDQPGNPAGRIVINFNDAGVEPGLAMSAHGSDYTLILDCSFLSTRGYAHARKHFEGHRLPWRERRDTVLWRGSSLGQKHRAILDMPRARLCQIAQSAPNDWFDIGLVHLFDITEAEADQLRALGLVKPRVSWKEFGQHRFHIDIDGHANSFAGLFLKLLSGGLVLKVASPDGYAQWYYDRLKPWENFVPIRSDLSDLLDVTAYCRDHDKLSQRIARRGRQLALSLTFEREFARMIESVKGAFAK